MYYCRLFSQSETFGFTTDINLLIYGDMIKKEPIQNNKGTAV